MARRTNWWLEGWQYQDTLGPSGKLRRELVYQGEYYGFRLERHKLLLLKTAIIAMVVLLAVTYGVTFSVFQTNAARIFVGAGMLAVIPMMYMLIGTFCLVPVGEKLTYRAYRGSVVRIRWAAVAVAVLSGICVTGEFIHLIIGGERAATELWWLAGTGVCLLDACGLILLEYHFRPRLIPPELK